MGISERIKLPEDKTLGMTSPGLNAELSLQQKSLVDIEIEKSSAKESKTPATEEGFSE